MCASSWLRSALYYTFFNAACGRMLLNVTCQLKHLVFVVPMLSCYYLCSYAEMFERACESASVRSFARVQCLVEPARDSSVLHVNCVRPSLSPPPLLLVFIIIAIISSSFNPYTPVPSARAWSVGAGACVHMPWSLACQLEHR